jgi:hypothetical protein
VSLYPAKTILPSLQKGVNFEINVNNEDEKEIY